MIFRPKLPPRAGYVEVELDGKRVYVNVSTGQPMGQEGEKPTLTGLAQSVTGLEDALCEVDAAGEARDWELSAAITRVTDDTGEQVTGLEDALCEMDAMNEARMDAVAASVAEIETALCELDGLINGLAMTI